MDVDPATSPGLIDSPGSGLKRKKSSINEVHKRRKNFDIPLSDHRKWEKMGSMPFPRADHKAVAVGNKIYVFGGYNKTNNEDENQLSKIFVYDVSTGNWEIPETTGITPTPRRGHTMSVYENRIFIVCGQSPTTNAFLNDTLVFNTTNNTWSTPPELQGHISKGRRDHAAGNMGGNIVFFGGWENHNGEYGVFNTARVLRISNPNEYSRKRYNVSTESHPLALMNHSAISDGNHIYVVGGAHGRDCLNNNVYQLIPPSYTGTNTVVRAQSLEVVGSGPTHRLWVAVAQSNPKDSPLRAFFFGGAQETSNGAKAANSNGEQPSAQDAPNFMDDLHQLTFKQDSATCCWSLIPVLYGSEKPVARAKAACCVVGDYFYLFGGRTNKEIRSDCWRINISHFNDDQQRLKNVMTLAEGLRNLFHSGELADITFNVHYEDTTEKIYAHRAILLSQCERFRALFSSGMVDSNVQEITINDHPPKVYRAMIQYLYTRQYPCTLSTNEYHDLLRLADEYILKDLKDFCGEILKEDFTPENVIPILISANTLSAARLKADAFEYILKNYRAVCSTENYKMILESTNHDLLSECNNLVAERISSSLHK